MRLRLTIVSLGLLATLALGCGAKQPAAEEKKPAAGEAAKPASGDEKTKEKQEAVVSAQNRLKDWLGTDLSAKVADLGKSLGKDLGLGLAKNPKVLEEAKALSKALFRDPAVKPRLDKMEEKATAGFGNKLTLGWKALQAGGIDEYRAKVSGNAQRVATEVLMEHLRDGVLKDPRLATLLQTLGPALKMQGKVAAAGMQENISPRVTKKILSIALKIAAEGDKAEVAARVEQWIEGCKDYTEAEVEQLFKNMATLQSLGQGVAELTVDVMKHARTKKELSSLAVTLLDDSQVNAGLVKVYEAAAFDKGDAAIRDALVRTIALPAVDRELFATLERLAAAEGAGPLIAKHVTKVSEDPMLAGMVEDFVMSVLETCGNPVEPSK